MDYWGLPWLTNSHSTREEFLKGPGGLCFAVFFLVVSFILEFFEQKFSDKFFCLVFYSNLLKQRQVRNKSKICLVKRSTKDSHTFSLSKKCLFLAILWDIFWSASYMSISRVVRIWLYKFSLHFLYGSPRAAECSHLGYLWHTSTAYGGGLEHELFQINH